MDKSDGEKDDKFYRILGKRTEKFYRELIKY